MNSNERKRIDKIVFRFDLDKRTRERVITWRRFYLCNYLKKTYKDLTLRDIAEIVGLTQHDEVLYAIKRHKELTKKGNSEYKKKTKHIVTALKYGTETIGQNLPEEVLKASSLEDLLLIKEKLKDGVL